MDVVIENLRICKSRHGFQGRTAMQCLSGAFMQLSTQVDKCIQRKFSPRTKKNVQHHIAGKVLSSRLSSVGGCLALCAFSRNYMRTSCARSCVMSFSEHKTFAWKILVCISSLLVGTLLLKAWQACILVDSTFPAQGLGHRDSSASARPPFAKRCGDSVRQDVCWRGCRNGCAQVSRPCMQSRMWWYWW